MNETQREIVRASLESLKRSEKHIKDIDESISRAQDSVDKTIKTLERFESDLDNVNLWVKRYILMFLVAIAIVLITIILR